MRYLAALFVLFALNGSAQQEIFLQTNPDDRYVISYSTNSYTLLFDYQDFLNAVHADFQGAVEAFVDVKLATQETFELNRNGQVVFIENDDLDLKKFFEWRMLVKLMRSGNVIVMDPTGKPTVSSVIYNLEPANEFGMRTTYTDASTNEKIFVGERHFRTTGCPSF